MAEKLLSLLTIIQKAYISNNRTECAAHEYIARKLNAKFYFAHSYSLWKRGLNEYTNKFIDNILLKKLLSTYFMQSAKANDARSFILRGGVKGIKQIFLYGIDHFSLVKSLHEFRLQRIKLARIIIVLTVLLFVIQQREERIQPVPKTISKIIIFFLSR